MFRFEGHTGEISDSGLAFSADGRILASGGEDKTVRLWDVPSRTLRATLKGHTQFVTTLTFVPTTTCLVSGSWDGTFIVWDTEKAKKLRKVKGIGSVIDVAASPDGKRLAAAGGEWAPRQGNHIHLYDTSTWKETARVGEHHMQIGKIVFTPDGKRIVSGGADRNVMLWDLVDDHRYAPLRHTGWVQGMTVHGSILAVTAGRRLTLWSLPKEKEEVRQLAVLTGPRRTILGVVFSPDGRLLAAGGKDGCVHLWDVERGSWLKHYRWKIGVVHGLAFAPDGMTMAAGGDRDIVVWDLD